MGASGMLPRASRTLATGGCWRLAPAGRLRLPFLGRMRAVQFMSALGTASLLVVACGGQGMKAAGGSGGTMEAGGAVGGVVGTGGAIRIAATGGAGGAQSADAGSTKDPGSPDSSRISCRPAPPCPSGWDYVYKDSACSWGGTVSICTARGDGLCYRECKANSDCTDPIFPTCESINLYNGSDYAESKKGVCLGGSRCPQDAGS
jgi:hypothetical protein